MEVSLILSNKNNSKVATDVAACCYGVCVRTGENVEYEKIEKKENVCLVRRGGERKTEYYFEVLLIKVIEKGREKVIFRVEKQLEWRTGYQTLELH